MVHTRVHHYRPGASSSTPVKIGTPPRGPAPLLSSCCACGLEQPGGSGPRSPPPRQHSNLHGLGEALQPARQARARREPSGCASRSSHQHPTSAAEQSAAVPRGPVWARPPATPRSPPEVVRGHLRVPRRWPAAPLHGPVYRLVGVVDSGRILLGPDRALGLCVRHVGVVGHAPCICFS
ncbi:hypothetical protein NDU88_003703 [Pleurodeles waltl]|uniref:Uncharacterized protein n=1 Tax=Pleurodeles waltl TaxID=8319 RepID=A0AAV7W669_PLEWA|nr:hypothetical protein NDU88_003703 [Pleurodeles waltl]